MIREVHQRMNTHVAASPELSTLFTERKITLSPTTLYVDNGAILMSGPTLDTTGQIIKMAFKETHNWLSLRGLKMDQVKNELMHFTKTKNRDNNPSVHIPLNIPRDLNEVT